MVAQLNCMGGTSHSGQNFTWKLDFTDRFFPSVVPLLPDAVTKNKGFLKYCAGVSDNSMWHFHNFT